MYQQTRTKVQNELNSALGICLTTDIWTSQSNHAYMTVTAHFVDIAGSRMKSFVLETTEFTGNHTAERIVERLGNICIEWSILDKIVCLVSDTCNAMKKVGTDFSKGWFECTDHLINLCVNDVVRQRNEVKNILTTVRHIVSFVRESHLARETLNKYQRSFGFSERQLIYDVKTRWNSTYYMLHRFIDEKISIAACLNEKSFQKNLTKAKLSRNIDWEMQEQLMSVLELFESATRKLAMESSPTISLVLPVIASLIRSLESRTTDSMVIKQIKAPYDVPLKKDLKRCSRTKSYYWLLFLIRGGKTLPFLQSSSYQQYVETYTCLTKMAAFDARLLSNIHLHDEYAADVSAHPNLSQWDSQQDMTAVENTDFFDLLVINQPVKSGGDSNPEFVMYENEREIRHNENPLEWWRMNRSKYPRISKMTYRYLSVMASSAPSERMFSASGHLTSDKRSRLTPDNANILLFLNKNS